MTQTELRADQTLLIACDLGQRPLATDLASYFEDLDQGYRFAAWISVIDRKGWRPPPSPHGARAEWSDTARASGS